MAKKNFMYNPDGSKTEVGPDLDTPTQNDVDAANRKYRNIGVAKVKKDPTFSELRRLRNEANRPGYVPERIKPGTINKAISFVSKETKNPHWKEAEKKIVSMFDKVTGGSQDQQGLKPTMAKAFKYSCPDCGHTDEVATGGFGYDLQPKKWPCRKCGKENTKMTVLPGKSTPKWTDAQWKEHRSNPENTKSISAFHTGDPKPVKKADSGLPKCRLCGNDYNTYDARNLEQVRRMTKLGRCANCSDEGIKKSSGGIVPGGGPSDPRSGLNIAKPLGPTKVKKALDEFLEKYGTK
jgi:ribosomal protein L37AE/L43A